MEKFKIDEQLYPFKSNYIKINNEIKVHYVDEGEGPVILMLHGNPTWSFLYRKMINELKDEYRVIAPDYPGFGLSPTPLKYDFLPSTHSQIIEEFINLLDLKEIILVMQDWGGPIGLNIAINNPELVRGMVLGNTWAWPLKRFGQKMFSHIMGGYIGRWMAHSFNGVWHVFMKKGFVKSPSNRELAMYKAPFENSENSKQTAIFPKELYNSKSFLAKIESSLNILKEKPVLFTWGKHDFAFQKPELSIFQSIFKNHEVKMLDASHFWQDEQGELASKYIKNWASKTN
ncbi:alpha/beta fold hydrolase [Maribacter sp. HTCC2170]|uniref:alpha/beta fold hydrolase n=1 Tax=Maribacter sp. (strain HTCC2170 / KCCM 42371) TaxID=313603 RepID=UPI00006B2130|nr:alpha/beta fold hydrolase [Maribacter sp. HTCC2170]EAR00048.1 predicted hydrolase or acyltransferase (alpha/beta hydrolase superfamily) protein [Maribacter sp. HTCC2170]